MLPYEHDENLESQKKSQHLAQITFEQIQKREDATEGAKKYAVALVEYANKHAAVIEKFGRYPHRNEVIRRESTPEEIEYLQTADRFGQ